MTADILLVRHAAHAHLGNTLSGRMQKISLSPDGAEQARRLADRLAGCGLDALQSSPVLRARETAAAVADRLGLTVTEAEPLNEVDFGDWTGQGFRRSRPGPALASTGTSTGPKVTAPGGESMAAVQQRIMAHLRQVASAAAGKVVAMVSHCDVIRAAVAGVLGLSLDRLLQFEIGPASVSRIRVGEWGGRGYHAERRGCMMTGATRRKAAEDEADTSDLRERVERLAPWFQNIDLGHGIATAPDHFLGDYPAFKYRRFARCPA